MNQSLRLLEEWPIPLFNSCWHGKERAYIRGFLLGWHSHRCRNVCCTWTSKMLFQTRTDFNLTFLFQEVHKMLEKGSNSKIRHSCRSFSTLSLSHNNRAISTLYGSASKQKLSNKVWLPSEQVFQRSERRMRSQAVAKF